MSVSPEPPDSKVIQSAAMYLYDVMAESTQDALLEMWIDSYPGGREMFYAFLSRCSAEELEAYQEPIFRQVMAELTLLCLTRSLGRFEATS